MWLGRVGNPKWAEVYNPLTLNKKPTDWVGLEVAMYNEGADK